MQAMIDAEIKKPGRYSKSTAGFVAPSGFRNTAGKGLKTPAQDDAYVRSGDLSNPNGRYGTQNINTSVDVAIASANQNDNHIRAGSPDTDIEGWNGKGARPDAATRGQDNWFYGVNGQGSVDAIQSAGLLIGASNKNFQGSAAGPSYSLGVSDLTKVLDVILPILSPYLSKLSSDQQYVLLLGLLVKAASGKTYSNAQELSSLVKLIVEQASSDAVTTGVQFGSGITDDTVYTEQYQQIGMMSGSPDNDKVTRDPGATASAVSCAFGAHDPDC